MSTFQQKIKGVTLLEILLVLAIASSLLIMVLNYTTQKADELRRDKTVLQIQQLLNAGMSFYVNKSFWPMSNATITDAKCGTSTWSDLSSLKPDFIPDSLSNSSYGKAYQLNCNNVGSFFVMTETNSAANAKVIVGRLPMAYRTRSQDLSTFPPPLCEYGDDCDIVVSRVNIPGQNLNNARSVNFASTYYSGSCVPAPNCPPNMKQNILVMPAAVTGANEAPNCTTPPCVATINPVSSFTAYAVGTDSKGLPGDPNTGLAGCTDRTRILPCQLNAAGYPIPSNGTLYWRVCLSVTTDQGLVTPYAPIHGKTVGTLIAITRCVPNEGDENPSGSIDVWQR